MILYRPKYPCLLPSLRPPSAHLQHERHRVKLHRHPTSPVPPAARWRGDRKGVLPARAAGRQLDPPASSHTDSVIDDLCSTLRKIKNLLCPAATRPAVPRGGVLGPCVGALPHAAHEAVEVCAAECARGDHGRGPPQNPLAGRPDAELARRATHPPRACQPCATTTTALAGC